MVGLRHHEACQIEHEVTESTEGADFPSLFSLDWAFHWVAFVVMLTWISNAKMW